MFSYVVWIDHKKAKLYKLVAQGKIETKNIESHGEQTESHTERFFNDVAKLLKDSSEVLLVGPGLGKEHFKHHLEKHHNEQIAKKIVGMLNADDHMSEKEVLASARKFFRSYDILHD